MKTKELKKIIGSLLVVGFDGPRLTESCQNFLEQWELGGVILFKRNIESLEQVQALNESIYETAQVTPIVSVDHEGGRVFRLPEPFTDFPPMACLGERCAQEQITELAQEVGRAFGTELRAAGFNLDYAPVLDVDSNPDNPIIGDRAFGKDPEQVAQVALEFLKGLQETGVLGCGKHFPGHGDTTEDSHLTLPKVEKTLEELEAGELIPFRQAVQHNIPLLMTAHVVYSALDPDWPATLSDEILNGLLHQKLGFVGLVASDDLFMKGISEKWPVEEAAERFLKVGGDLLLLCHQESVQRRIAAHLVHRAEKDSTFRDLLTVKYHQMEKFRKKLSSGVQPVNFKDLTEKHLVLAESLRKS